MKSIENYYNLVLQEGYSFKQLENGLKIYIIKKPGFKEFVAAFSTKYGSDAINFTVDGTHYSTPTGIAHFLEHKLFACSDGVDATEKFANLDLYSNAYTSQVETTYYCSGTVNFSQGLETLLDFVQEPYFTDLNVESERGIIIQELMMYKDIPVEVIMDKMKNNLFSKHPYKNDIGGTVDDVKKITKEDLYLCHKTFYHPSNMILTIIGDVDVEKTFDLIIQNQNKKDFGKIPTIVIDKYDEPTELNQEYSEGKMDIVMPKVALAIKLPSDGLTGESILLESSYINMMLKYNFENSSKFYQSLLHNKLINGPLKYHYSRVDGIRYIYFYCDTVEPKKFIKAMKNKIKMLTKTKIPHKRFELTKKRLIGSWIYDFNFINEELFDFLDYYHDNINFFQLLDLFKNMDYDKSCEVINSLDLSLVTIAVLYPKENAEV